MNYYEFAGTIVLVPTPLPESNPLRNNTLPSLSAHPSNARMFLAYTEQSQLSCETISRDRDGEYTADFDRLFQKRGIAVKPVGPRAPNVNAFIERWIQSLKHEALNHFVVFGLAHFDRIVREFVDYYHDCRPHQGIGNRPIGADTSDRPPLIECIEQLECESRLGGLLRTYRRAA